MIRISPKKSSRVLISTFARINPAIVDIDWLWQKVDFRLIFFGTDATLDTRRISTFIPENQNKKRKELMQSYWNNGRRPIWIGHLHFHFARFLVIAERTIELNVQRLDVLALRWWLSLCFAASHFSPVTSLLRCIRMCQGIPLKFRPNLEPKIKWKFYAFYSCRTICITIYVAYLFANDNKHRCSLTAVNLAASKLVLGGRLRNVKLTFIY